MKEGRKRERGRERKKEDRKERRVDMTKESGWQYRERERERERDSLLAEGGQDEGLGCQVRDGLQTFL